MKAAGYIRVSTLSQAEEGESLSTQFKQIKSFVKDMDQGKIGELDQNAY